MCDPIKETYELILNHLKSNGIHITAPKWTLKESQLGGRGLFSTCDIKPGEVIFVDCPIIMGPRSGVDIPPRCVTCFKKDTSRMCSKQCGLIVCGIDCENSEQHIWECNKISNWKDGSKNLKNITRYLSPIRALRLNSYKADLMKHLKSHYAPQHGFEVECLKDAGLMIPMDEEILMKFASSVMDANAFEIVMGDEEFKTSFRGLYPLSGFANHRCYPNAMHVFDERQRMVVKSCEAILEGEEIFHSYSRITWNTFTRRYHLARTKHFLCNCLRCQDSTEFGSNLSALYCDICAGIVLPSDPLNFKTEWECKTCGAKKSNQRVAFVLSVFGSRLGSFADNDVDDMILFVNRNQLPQCNHIIIEIKVKLIFILGCKDGYFWKGKICLTICGPKRNYFFNPKIT